MTLSELMSEDTFQSFIMITQPLIRINLSYTESFFTYCRDFREVLCLPEIKTVR
jgi:hypothetical protein